VTSEQVVFSGSPGLAVRIDAVRVDQPIDDPIFAMLLDAVTEERRARTLRFLRRIDAVRSLFAELLLREVLTERGLLARSGDELVLHTDEKGKPSLPAVRGFHFNLSHSGDWVVCASGSPVVGVDVERIRERVPDILDRVLSDAERAAFARLGEDERRQFFFARWAVKEAYAKALGEGVGMPFHELTVVEAAGGVVRFSRNEALLDEVACRRFSVDANHAAAVCVFGADPPSDARFWEASAIIDRVRVRSRPLPR
jgi:4'-phosphopantetheinyl transferase